MCVASIVQCYFSWHQGNYYSQDVIFDRQIMDIINRILQTSFFSGCKIAEVTPTHPQLLLHYCNVWCVCECVCVHACMRVWVTVWLHALCCSGNATESFCCGTTWSDVGGHSQEIARAGPGEQSLRWIDPPHWILAFIKNSYCSLYLRVRQEINNAVFY